jgi:hypothetical protein
MRWAPSVFHLQNRRDKGKSGMAASKKAKASVPEGYRPVPISQSDKGAALRICVLARESADPVAGHLVRLRELHDGSVYLGCVVDAGSRVHEWIEIWVQNVDGLDAALPAVREAFGNHGLDTRWGQQAEILRKLHPNEFIETGLETAHPTPTFLDVANGEPVHPDNGSVAWNLCRDDRALGSAGLPAYSTSPFRYLSDGNTFVPVVKGSPESAATKSLTEAMPSVSKLVPFNTQGGLMMVLPFYPLPLADYCDLLAGKAWPGIEHGKRTIKFDGVYASLGDTQEFQQSNAHLFLGSHGRAGRFLEAFHLKLQLLLDVVRSVRTYVDEQQRPFLNLNVDSFRVRLHETGAGLPFLWTARSTLTQPGNSFALPVESSEFRYFMRASASGRSIYLPDVFTGAVQSYGSVRIRKVFPPDNDRVVVEGTLVMDEKLNVSQNDLLWIRLPMASGRVDLYGHMYTSEGLAQGEARFRTEPQRLPAAVITALQQAEGVSFPKAPFDVVPLLSSPCDLYSLAVIAVRMFFVNNENTLAVSLDEMLSLARQLGTEYSKDLPRGERVREVFERDSRYKASLAPNSLTHESISADEAFRLLPSEIWYELLGAIASLFPGVGPDSVSKDYGDVPALALETVFDRPIADLTNLVERSRSLIVIDWGYNREIHSAIKQQLQPYQQQS